MRRFRAERLIPLAIAATFSVGCDQATQPADQTMTQDEQSVREWFDGWIKATTVGDADLARSLTADDAVFLIPGVGQMEKETFIAGATGDDPSREFELDCKIQEIKILGDHAWVIANVDLLITEKATGAKSRCKGDSLSVIRREGDGWVTIREANTMVPVGSPE
ncbi:MAG: DUF4440 domain-containing protein [Planctomycetota bacterium]